MPADQGPPGPERRRPRYPPPPPGSEPRSQSSPQAGARIPRTPRAPGAERAGRTAGAERAANGQERTAYHRYRAGGLPSHHHDASRASGGPPLSPGTRKRTRFPRITPKRAILGLLALTLGWLLLSLLLFLVSSHFERISPPANVASALEGAGYPLTSVNNILVLGSDRREKGSREPGANTSGPSRSDTIMLIRTGGGHSAKLSIPRDTVIEIPGHGLQKINAAYAFGGPRMSIEVIKRWLGVPINHVVEVNFEDFPALIDSMGGITYTGGCIFSKIAGGASNGGWTLRLPPGTHHLDGREALIIARTRHNLCAPSQDDINREEHQQAIFQAMKSQLLSPTAFLRLPLISWNAPPAIISDMSGPTLLALFASLAIEGNAPTKILRPTGAITLPDGEEGLTISPEAKQRDVREFMAG